MKRSSWNFWIHQAYPLFLSTTSINETVSLDCGMEGHLRTDCPLRSARWNSLWVYPRFFVTACGQRGKEKLCRNLSEVELRRVPKRFPLQKCQTSSLRKRYCFEHRPALKYPRRNWNKNLTEYYHAAAELSFWVWSKFPSRPPLRVEPFRYFELRRWYQTCRSLCVEICLQSKTAREHADVLIERIRREIAPKYTVGPFRRLPSLAFLVISQSVRAESNGTFKVDMDLSYPFGDSVNIFINIENFSLCCCRVEDALPLLSVTSKGALIGKKDIEHAFRLIPVRQQDWYLLDYHRQNQYYFNTVLPLVVAPRRTCSHFPMQSSSFSATQQAAKTFGVLWRFLDCRRLQSKSCSAVMKRMYTLCAEWVGCYASLRLDRGFHHMPDLFGHLLGFCSANIGSENWTKPPIWNQTLYPTWQSYGRTS